ncbi:MAG: glycosyltransferase, partial [Daejeonella sp.]|uniref:glycosyltransferase n=1 Tax=Daejeonella sp. TaxID=2805397 RepID=UPI003C74AA46
SYTEYAEQYFTGTDRYFVLATGLFPRLKQVFSFLRQNRHAIHHVEIYPGGRFSFIYMLLVNFFNIATICVERGDLLYFKRGGYDLITRFSMWICYKRARIVWYRELYMEEILQRLKIKRMVFIHNAVEIKQKEYNGVNSLPFQKKRIDFLWVNRLIPERKSDWFVDILNTDRFRNTQNILAGVLKQTLYNTEQDYVIKNKPANLRLLDFVSDPWELYKESKFFVLPSSVVFANNALLEAMSVGVVPVIVNSTGYELIVQDGINGLVSDYSRQGFEDVMVRAKNMDETDYARMSEAAMNHIKTSFSSETYQ